MSESYPGNRNMRGLGFVSATKLLTDVHKCYFQIFMEDNRRLYLRIRQVNVRYCPFGLNDPEVERMRKEDPGRLKCFVGRE